MENASAGIWSSQELRRHKAFWISDCFNMQYFPFLVRNWSRGCIIIEIVLFLEYNQEWERNNMIFEGFLAAMFMFWYSGVSSLPPEHKTHALVEVITTFYKQVGWDGRGLMHEWDRWEIELTKSWSLKKDKRVQPAWKASVLTWGKCQNISFVEELCVRVWICLAPKGISWKAGKFFRNLLSDYQLLKHDRSSRS